MSSSTASSRPERVHYRWFCPIPTRWMDNDVYGHVNNVAYYSYFDTAANRFLIERGGLDIQLGETVGLVVESQCRYHAAVAFPDDLVAGLRVERLSTRAVTYGIGIFAEDDPRAKAHSHFVHVFVDRVNNRATAIPEAMRRALEAIRIADNG